MFYAVEKLRKEKGIQRAKKNYFDRGKDTDRRNANKRAKQRVTRGFAFVWRICLRRSDRKNPRVYLLATGAFLSYFLPRRLKRELDGVPAGQEEVLYGRSIKCSDAVQAKSNGNSQRGVEVHLLVSAPQVTVEPVQHRGIVAHNVRTTLFHLALALPQRYSVFFKGFAS